MPADSQEVYQRLQEEIVARRQELDREVEASRLQRAGLTSKQKVQRARKAGSVFTLFMQEFSTEEAKQEFWDSLMRILDKQLQKSGLSITHAHVPTKLMCDWLGGPNTIRSVRFGKKDVLAITEFIDDTWPQLFQLEQLPGLPADPIQPSTMPKPKNNVTSSSLPQFVVNYVDANGAPIPGEIGGIIRW